MFGAGVLAQQRGERGLGGLLLLAQLGDLLMQDVELLLAMLLVRVFFLDGLLAFLLLGQLVMLMAKLLKALADLLVQLHEGRGRVAAQAFQGVGGQQAGEGVEFFVEALAVVGQLALLVDQQLARLLARVLGGLQLLLQAPGVLLQVEQGALALFVLGDALGQLAELLGQSMAAFGFVLIEQRGRQWVRVQAGLERVLLGCQVFLLLQEFFLLGDQAAHFAT